MYMDVIRPGVNHGDGVIPVTGLAVSPLLPLSSLLSPSRHTQSQENAAGNQGQENEDRAHRNDGDYVPGRHEIIQDVLDVRQI